MRSSKQRKPQHPVISQDQQNRSLNTKLDTIDRIQIHEQYRRSQVENYKRQIEKEKNGRFVLVPDYYPHTKIWVHNSKDEVQAVNHFKFKIMEVGKIRL